jgi:hypothetical protein
MFDLFRRMTLTGKILVLAVYFGLLSFVSWKLIVEFRILPLPKTIDVPRSESAELALLRRQQSEAEERIAVLSKTLAEVRTPTGQFSALNPADRETLNRAIESQKDLDMRLRSLEDALRLDASKALVVPLMRKDLDTLQDTFRADTALVQNEINRLYGLAQWFIGLMFTILLGFFGLALTNILLRPKESAKAPEESAITRK